MVDLIKLADRVEADNYDTPLTETGAEFIWEIYNTLFPNAERKHWGDYDTEAVFVLVNGEHILNFLTFLDAAQALHDAVLPGWYVIHAGQNPISLSWFWAIGCSANHPDAEVVDGGHYCKNYDGEASNPAAAWVAAILRAKAQEETNAPSS